MLRCYRRPCSKVAVLYFPEYRISSLTTLILSWLSLLSGLKGRRSGCFVLRSASEVLTQAAQWLIISNLWARGENMNVYCESMKTSYWTKWMDNALPLVNCDHWPLTIIRPGRWAERNSASQHCKLQSPKKFRVNGNYAQNRIHEGMRVLLSLAPRKVKMRWVLFT